MGIATTGRDNAAINAEKWRRFTSTGKAGKTGSRNKSGKSREKKKKKTKVERSEREVGLEGGASHLEGRFSCNDVTRGTREKSLTTV